MRDYAMTQASSYGSIGFSLKTLLTNWQARCDVKKFKDCTDDVLCRAGLTREDFDRVLRLPLTENPRLALEQLAFMRSRTLGRR